MKTKIVQCVRVWGQPGSPPEIAHFFPKFLTHCAFILKKSTSKVTNIDFYLGVGKRTINGTENSKLLFTFIFVLLLTVDNATLMKFKYCITFLSFTLHKKKEKHFRICLCVRNPIFFLVLSWIHVLPYEGHGLCQNSMK